MPYIDPEMARQSRRRYYLLKRSAVLESRKRYRKSEAGKAAKKRYYQKHKAKYHEYYLNHVAKNRDVINAKKLKWYHENKAVHLARARKRKYGITQAEYEAMAARQKGKCAICSCECSNLHIDHSHVTGKVRALLCGSCNRALGVVERREWLPLAMAYLESHEECP